MKGRMKMRKMKRFMAITLLAALMCLGVPQAFGGDMHAPLNGTQETPGVTADGVAESPGFLSLVLLFFDGVLISD
jgi:hypothetical protein